MNSSECNFPPGVVVINSVTGLTFLLLFISFYKETYGRQKRAQAKLKELNGTSKSAKFVKPDNSLRDEVATKTKDL